MKPALPTGEVTFLFTDIEGSTELVQRLGDAWSSVIADHHAILRRALAAGAEVGTAGDAFFVAFRDADEAVRAAIDAQQALARHDFAGGASIKVRIGIHTGHGELVDGDYIGLDVHRAARICSAAWGGQILMSAGTVARLRAPGDELRWDDLGEHRLKDLAEPVGLHTVRHPELRGDLPPPRTLTVLPNNLPAQVTSFVGRQNAVDAVRAELATTRMLTLTGPGGCGKTRLALQVAAEEITTFDGGVWFVDLQPVTEPVGVGQAVARRLGVRERPGEEPLDTVAGHVGSSATLLMLDNCEHLREACAAAAAQLLRACPRLRLLVTSRAVLGVDGETTWPVPALADDAACALFIDRARAARPSLVLGAQDRELTTRLCRELDGLPLAIELAAARVRSLSVGEIAGRLHDRFRLLGGSRVTEGRHATLEATVRWSYDLLEPAERTLFVRLSVFAGGFTLDAAERVASGDGIDDADVLDTLSALVDRSLVVADIDPGRTRYRMLETLRSYAAQQLARGEDEAATRDRHLAWAVDVAETAPDTGVGRRLDEELDNVRAALAWSLDADDTSAGIRLVVLAQIGNLPEWMSWCDRLLEAVADGEPRTRLVARAAGIAFMSAEWSRALDLFDEAREGLVAIGDLTEAGICLVYQGLCRWGQGDESAAGPILEAAARELDAQGDTHGLSRGLLSLAMWNIDRDPRRTASLLDRAEILDRSRFDIAHGDELRARLAWTDGDTGAAAHALGRALEAFLEDGNGFCLAHCLESVAAMAAATGGAVQAARLLGSVASMRDRTGDRARPWDMHALRAAEAAVLAALGADEADAARAQGAGLDDDGAIDLARQLLAQSVDSGR